MQKNDRNYKDAKPGAACFGNYSKMKEYYHSLLCPMCGLCFQCMKKEKEDGKSLSGCSR